MGGSGGSGRAACLFDPALFDVELLHETAHQPQQRLAHPEIRRLLGPVGTAAGAGLAQQVEKTRRQEGRARARVCMVGLKV